MKREWKIKIEWTQQIAPNSKDSMGPRMSNVIYCTPCMQAGFLQDKELIDFIQVKQERGADGVRQKLKT